MYISEMLYLYLYGEVVWAGVRLELPFCPGRVVVGQPRYALIVWAQVLRRLIEVAVYTLGNFWVGRSRQYSSAARTLVHLSLSRSLSA